MKNISNPHIQRSHRIRQVLRSAFNAVPQKEVNDNEARPTGYLPLSDLLIADFGEALSSNTAYPSAQIFQMAPQIEEKRKNTLAASIAYMINLRSNYVQSVTGDQHYQLLEKENDFTSSTGHEAVHVLQHHFNRCASWLEMIPPQAFKVLDQIKRHTDLTPEQERINAYTQQRWNKTVPDYFAVDCEIQARLHEILAWSYQMTHQLPASKTELHALLYNAGLHAPDEIIEGLQDSTEGRAALQKFELNEKPFAHLQFDIDNINIVYDYAQNEQLRRDLWNDLYTGLYANLIEIYGIEQGRAALGLGESKTAALQLSSLNDLCRSTSDLSSHTIENAMPLLRNLCERIDAQDAANFIKLKDVRPEIEELLRLREDVQQALESDEKPKYGHRYLERPQIM